MELDKSKSIDVEMAANRDKPNGHRTHGLRQGRLTHSPYLREMLIQVVYSKTHLVICLLITVGR